MCVIGLQENTNAYSANAQVFIWKYVCLSQYLNVGLECNVSSVYTCTITLTRFKFYLILIKCKPRLKGDDLNLDIDWTASIWLNYFI